MSRAERTFPVSADHEACLARAYLSLDGLSVGDAFGQRFFYPPSVESLIAERAVPAPPWPYTDDTEMALGIAEVLRRQGRIEQDDLAGVFASRYRVNSHRSYGRAGPMSPPVRAACSAWKRGRTRTMVG